MKWKILILKIDIEKEIKVNYKGIIIGNFRADIVVEDKVIIEIKAISTLNSQHEAQLLNYLKATGIRVGLLWILEKNMNSREEYINHRWTWTLWKNGN